MLEIKYIGKVCIMDPISYWCIIAILTIAMQFKKNYTVIYQVFVACLHMMGNFSNHDKGIYIKINHDKLFNNDLFKNIQQAIYICIANI